MEALGAPLSAAVREGGGQAINVVNAMNRLQKCFCCFPLAASQASFPLALFRAPTEVTPRLSPSSTVVARLLHTKRINPQ